MRRRAVHLESLVNEIRLRVIAYIPKQSWKVDFIRSVITVFLKDPLQ